MLTPAYPCDYQPDHYHLKFSIHSPKGRLLAHPSKSQPGTGTTKQHLAQSPVRHGDPRRWVDQFQVGMRAESFEACCTPPSSSLSPSCAGWVHPFTLVSSLPPQEPEVKLHYHAAKAQGRRSGLARVPSWLDRALRQVS